MVDRKTVVGTANAKSTVYYTNDIVVVPPASINAALRLASGDQLLAVNNSGAIVPFTSSSGAGGGGDVSTTQANTYQDFNQTFRSSRLRITNPANTFSYNFTGSAIAANRSLTIPLLNSDDSLCTIAAGQTLSTKTINATDNTITDNSTAAGDLLKSNGSKFTRLAMGSANQVLSVNSGATDLTWATPAVGGGGASGAGDVFLNQANTFGDFDNTFRSSRLKITNPANTFNYTFVGGAIAAARNITLPLLTASDNLVTEAFPQTLTSKTMASGAINASGNSITNIGDSNIGSHTSTKITITTKGQLNSSISYTDQANTFGDFDQIYRSSRLYLSNPANTFNYKFAGAAIGAARTITLPLLTGNDTLVCEQFTQSLSNKTIDTGNNTISNISDANIATHTTTKITVSGKSLLNSSIVYIDQANTYSDNDQIFRSSRVKVRNPANTFSYSLVGAAIAAARNITLPLLTADDTSVTEAFTQTLTNKTISASGNTITDTNTAAGDILKSDGTKFVRLARGSSNQVLATNAGGTDVAWSSLDNERVGKSTAGGNGSTTVFNVAHGLGSNPTYTFASCSSLTTAFTYTTDSTNIVVTFASAPASGASNVTIYWQVVA